MTVGAELGQYFVQTHIKKIPKIQWGIKLPNLLWVLLRIQRNSYETMLLRRINYTIRCRCHSPTTFNYSIHEVASPQ